MPDPRRNPFEGVTDFVSELSRMRSLGVHGSETTESSERTHASAWVPPTDILAQGDDLVIRIELAGVEPADVDLSFHHGVLTVSGTRSPATEDTEYYVRERFTGAFRRVITLPQGTEAAHLTAEFDNGLVEITVAGTAPPPETTRIELADKSRGATSREVGSTPES